MPKGVPGRTLSGRLPVSVPVCRGFSLSPAPYAVPPARGSWGGPPGAALAGRLRPGFPPPCRGLGRYGFDKVHTTGDTLRGSGLYHAPPRLSHLVSVSRGLAFPSWLWPFGLSPLSGRGMISPLCTQRVPPSVALFTRYRAASGRCPCPVVKVRAGGCATHS